MTIKPRILIISLTMFALGVGVAGAQRRHQVQMGYGHRSPAVEAYLAESVDTPPQFPGGELALMRYINSERRYPADAYNAGLQGRVLCAFIVGTDGSISNVEVLRGVDESLNREAVRVIQKMPRWRAGLIGRTAVPVYCILPVPFRL